jgi:acetyl esterase/lipase
VYLPRDLSRPRRPTYTVVFMHGGGYYIRDKTRPRHRCGRSRASKDES